MFPLQTVQAAFEVLCLQRPHQVQTATENEKLEGEQQHLHVTHSASTQQGLHRLFLNTSQDYEAFMQCTKYINILTSRVKTAQKQGMGQRSVMLSLAKAVGLALPSHLHTLQYTYTKED